MPFCCHVVSLRVYIVSFPFDSQSATVFYSHVICLAMPYPCRAPTMAYWKQLLKAMVQLCRGTAWARHGMCWINIDRRETASGRSAGVWVLPDTTRSSTNVFIRSIPFSNAGGKCETKQLWHGREKAYYFGARTWVLVWFTALRVWLQFSKR
jgi:hypothetical protein